MTEQANTTNIVQDVKQTLNDIHEGLNLPFGSWDEGYINALAHYNIINEDEYDKLLDFIKE